LGTLEAVVRELEGCDEGGWGFGWPP
jgi:hypothetical protein